MIVEAKPMLLLASGIALRTITANFTRDGEQTGNLKYAQLLSPSLEMFVVLAAIDGKTASSTVVASAVDGGDWLLLARDPAAPRRAAARYPIISGDTTLAIDFSEGSSGGGLPALLTARVRVDDVPAQREVIAMEQQTDGEWRIAGRARTEADGEVDLDLRVTGAGRVYAVCPDDFGTLFQPSLPVLVGDTIRPTLFQGWLYKVTQAGQLPAIEPAWWDETQAGPQPLGTARAEVIRYYQPQAHGPLPVEML